MLPREKNLAQIDGMSFDVIVIGGGATGLGIAVDSVTRGFKTLLLEKNDFAKATSSRSTKILHGGVRYLAQGNISLVREALKEKLYTYINAPHVARSMDFVIPCDNIVMQLFYATGMKMYDALAGFPKGYLSKMVSGSNLRNLTPEISVRHSSKGVIYNDGQFDDARMAVSLVKTLENHGGIALNYCEATSFIKDNEQIVGIQFLDKNTGKSVSVKSSCIFNATGIYSDMVSSLDKKDHKELVTLAQGIHLVVNKNVYSSDVAMLVPKTTDGRVLFFIPWYNKVIIGTTDVAVKEPTDDPVPTPEEVDLVIKNANLYLEKPLTKDDITSVYAGIRPLMKESNSTAKISREESLSISQSGLISIVGGKWTTYRHMAEKAINFAIQKNKIVKKECCTRSLKLAGYIGAEQAIVIPNNYRFYGSDYASIQKIDGFNKMLHEDLPICEAQIKWAVEKEHAVTIDDVLARRTRCLFINAQASIDICERVADIMAHILNKTEDWKKQQIKDFKDIATKYLVSNYL